MPGSMDGLKLAQAVRYRWPPVDIVITSGKQPRHNDLPKNIGFVAKPYDIGCIESLSRVLLKSRNRLMRSITQRHFAALNKTRRLLEHLVSRELPMSRAGVKPIMRPRANGALTTVLRAVAAVNDCSSSCSPLAVSSREDRSYTDASPDCWTHNRFNACVRALAHQERIAHVSLVY